MWFESVMPVHFRLHRASQSLINFLSCHALLCFIPYIINDLTKLFQYFNTNRRNPGNSLMNTLPFLYFPFHPTLHCATIFNVKNVL